MRPEGTRSYFGDSARAREELVRLLGELFSSWGYEPVELSALEPYDPAHPNAHRAFKLVDKNGEVLALRSEFTTALARALKEEGLLGEGPQRFRYAGALWLREAPAELGRLREFHQVGVELVGVSSPSADAELLALAHEALAAARVEGAVIEIGLPAFVRHTLKAAGLDEEATERLRRAVNKKAVPELYELVAAYGVKGKVREAILALPDLFGGQEVLAEAGRLAPNAEAKEALDWLLEVVESVPDLPLVFDLGLGRRYDYYSGLTFRALSPAHGFPLLGGGRYDGALLEKAAGFALGLERLLAASGLVPSRPERYLAASPAVAERLRREGKVALLATARDEEGMLAEARALGVRYLATASGVREVGE